MNTLSTIGYEAADLEDFIATLKAARVHTLVDVRQLPISRRKGFAKTALSKVLIDSGIEYVHLSGLGDPKEGRIAAREGRHDDFVEIFTSHMKTPEFKADLEKLEAISRQSDFCLMCYERDYKQCHRKFVSDAIAGIVDLEVQHLGVREGLAKGGRGRKKRTRSDTREGVAA